MTPRRKRTIPRWLGYAAIVIGVGMNQYTLELTIVPDEEISSTLVRLAVAAVQLTLVALGLFILRRRPRSRVPWDRFVLALASGVITAFAIFTILDTQLPGLLDVPWGGYFTLKHRYEPDSTLVMVPRTKQKTVHTRLKGDMWTPGDGRPAQSTEYRASYNELGFRRNGGEPPFDVVVIGDSFVEFGETDDNTLSENLRAATGLSTFNLGRAWYGPHQYVELLRRYGVGLAPKFALFCFFEGNDITDMRQYLQWMEGGDYYRFSVLEQDLPERFFIASADLLSAGRDWLARHLGVGAAAARDRWRVEVGVRTVWMKFAYWPEGGSAANLLQRDVGRALRTLLREFRELSTRNGIVPIVVYIPAKATIYGRYIVKETGTPVPEALEEFATPQASASALASLTEELSLDFVDLTPPFRERAADGALLYYPLDTHWTPEGRLVAAETIAEHLRSGWPRRVE